MDKFDIAILGGGPGGYIAAIRSAQLGAKTALIEQDKLGGTCLNRGCIPTKAIIASTTLLEKFKRAEGFGISARDVSIDLSKVILRKNEVVNKLARGLETLFAKNNITIFKGKGTALNSKEIEIETAGSSGKNAKSAIEARKLIIATGSTPTPLPNFPFDHQQFLTSDDLLEAKEVPARLDIVGGGVIGIHFAAIFSSFGSQVTIYEALPEILPGIDEEVIIAVKRILLRKNVVTRTNTRFSPSASSGKTLICVGRTPNLAGTESLNLIIEHKSIQTNEKMETSLPGVYAVGDVTSKKMLAHVAYEQGIVAAENALGASKTFNYNFVPIGIYTTPEIGSIGLSQKEAEKKHQNIRVGKFPFAALGIAQALGDIEGFIKVIADKYGKILGAHILGSEATTLIGIAAIAMRNGLSVEQLAETFQSHPSYPEGMQEAALSALKKSLHSLN